MSRDLPPPPLPPPLPPRTPIAGTAAAAAEATVCTNCCSDDRWILHCVRLRGVYRKLCTSCVLKLHPTSFCPTCFSLHDPTIPPSSTSIANSNKNLTCFKCSSVSHSTCVPPNAPRSPYLCFFCSNPSFKFFDIRKPTKNLPEGEQNIPDDRTARVLLAAARIAAISMNRARAAARAEAEKKVREAALARKRAKEAIDYVTALSVRVAAVGGGNKRREADVPEPAPALALGSSLKGPTVVPVRLEKNGGIGMVNNVAAAALNAPEIKNPDRLNSSNGSIPVPTTVVAPHLQGEKNGGIGNADRSTSSNGSILVPTTVVGPHMQGNNNNNNGSVNHVGGGKDGTVPQVK